LADQSGDELHLSFTEMERILGRRLPSSAYTKAWWSDTVDTSQRRVWRSAGWRVTGRQARLRVVTFRRQRDEPGER